VGIAGVNIKYSFSKISSSTKTGISEFENQKGGILHILASFPRT